MRSVGLIVLSIFLAHVFAAVPPASSQKPPLELLLSRRYPDFTKATDNKAALRLAGERTLNYLGGLSGEVVFHIGGRSYSPKVLAESVREFLRILDLAQSKKEFAALIRRNFDVFESEGYDWKGGVVFSDYYEPILSARFKRTPLYQYPLYRPPLEKALLLLSRKEIDVNHALAGRGLELAWLKDQFDAFDLQVQGSGILRFPRGVEILAQYAATNGLPYRAVGTALVKVGVFKKGKITKDKLRAYIKTHPRDAGKVLAQDPRYTFFKLKPFLHGEEPQGTSREPLVPGASIAVDPSIIPLGALAYMETTSPRADLKGRFLGQFKRRSFAFCLDTGGAIRGAGRVDIYVGHGLRAQTISANQWSSGKLFILVKKSAFIKK
jgi:membrane-bound lytic murein transglycosylase A